MYQLLVPLASSVTDCLFVYHYHSPAGASKKIQSMTFSTEHRADLLTEALVSLIFELIMAGHARTGLLASLIKMDIIIMPI